MTEYFLLRRRLIDAFINLRPEVEYNHKGLAECILDVEQELGQQQSASARESPILGMLLSNTADDCVNAIIAVLLQLHSRVIEAILNDDLPACISNGTITEAEVRVMEVDENPRAEANTLPTIYLNCIARKNTGLGLTRDQLCMLREHLTLATSAIRASHTGHTPTPSERAELRLFEDSYAQRYPQQTFADTVTMPRDIDNILTMANGWPMDNVDPFKDELRTICGVGWSFDQPIARLKAARSFTKHAPTTITNKAARLGWKCLYDAGILSDKINVVQFILMHPLNTEASKLAEAVFSVVARSYARWGGINIGHGGTSQGNAADKHPEKLWKEQSDIIACQHIVQCTIQTQAAMIASTRHQLDVYQDELRVKQELSRAEAEAKEIDRSCKDTINLLEAHNAKQQELIRLNKELDGVSWDTVVEEQLVPQHLVDDMVEQLEKTLEATQAQLDDIKRAPSPV